MSRTLSALFLALFLIPAATLTAAARDAWQIDPMHSSAQFSVRHLGISTVRGAFTKVSGTILLDEANPAKDQITASIDAASVDTRVEMRDNDLRSPNFFDVQKYPTITFKSKKIEPAGPGKLKVAGDLT
ncbi:MAG: YceI family protein, partial [Candidatus Sulfotelmatobacter sp.]